MIEGLIEKIFKKTYEDILWRGFSQGYQDALDNIEDGDTELYPEIRELRPDEDASLIENTIVVNNKTFVVKFNPLRWGIK